MQTAKAERAVHVVDEKAKREKAAKVNRKVTKKVFGKKDSAYADFSFVPENYIEFLKLVGSVLFIPIVLVFSILEGVKAGFRAGCQKALTMYRI